MDTGKKEIPLPVVDDVIKDVDIKKKRVEAEMIEGLEEL
jgi:ribosomal 30S subunit maturation factor RimM